MKATNQINLTKVIKTGVFKCSICFKDVHRDKMTVCPDCDDVICNKCEGSDKDCCCEAWECSRCGGDLLDCMCIEVLK